jgi:hypothetical protein
MEQLTMPSPDIYFWYGFSGLLSGSIIWILQRYIAKMDKFTDKVTKNLNELMQITKLHEHRINEIEEDIEEKNNVKIVKYRK